VVDSKPEKRFKFDFIADESISQDSVFSEIAKPIADCCLEGKFSNRRV